MKESKRGQMEILGLLIVIILFSLGLMFAVKYIILKPENTTKEEFVQAQLSSNTLSAFLKINAVDCRDTPMTELFTDCAGYIDQGFSSIDCDLDGETVRDTGLADSCTSIETALNQIFPQTLDKWAVNYNFTAYTVDEFNPFPWTKSIGSGDCGSFAEGKPQQFTLPTDLTEDLTIELKIC